MLNRPPLRATITDSARARRSRSPKPSTASTSYPARAADSANPRVETPAMSTRVKRAPRPGGAAPARAAPRTDDRARCRAPRGSPGGRRARGVSRPQAHPPRAPRPAPPASPPPRTPRAGGWARTAPAVRRSPRSPPPPRRAPPPAPTPPGRAPRAVDDPASRHGDGGGEGAAQLEQHERRGGEWASPSPRLLHHRERDGAHFVGRAHVDPIHLAVCRYGGEMDYAGCEHHRQRGARQDPQQGGEPGDAAWLPRRRQQGEPQIAVGGVARARERQAVAGRPGDEIERAGLLLEQPDEPCRVRQGVCRGYGAVQEQPAVIESAHVDAHRPRVDPDDAGHGVTASAPSTPARRRRWSRRPARGRCARTGARRTPCAPSS